MRFDSHHPSFSTVPLYRKGLRVFWTVRGIRGRLMHWNVLGHLTLGYFNHVITCWDQITNCVMISHWSWNDNFEFFWQNTDFALKFSGKLSVQNARLGAILLLSWWCHLSLWSRDWNILRSNVLLSIASAVNDYPGPFEISRGLTNETYYFEKVVFICLFFVFSK